MAQVNNRPLALLGVDDSAVVSRIPDDANGDLLRYLADLGLVPGTKLKVTHVAPFDGPMTLQINNKSIVIGQKVAEAVLVEVL